MLVLGAPSRLTTRQGSSLKIRWPTPQQSKGAKEVQLEEGASDRGRLCGGELNRGSVLLAQNRSSPGAECNTCSSSMALPRGCEGQGPPAPWRKRQWLTGLSEPSRVRARDPVGSFLGEGKLPGSSLASANWQLGLGYKLGLNLLACTIGTTELSLGQVSRPLVADTAGDAADSVSFHPAQVPSRGRCTFCKEPCRRQAWVCVGLWPACPLRLAAVLRNIEGMCLAVFQGHFIYGC